MENLWPWITSQWVDVCMDNGEGASFEALEPPPSPQVLGMGYIQLP